MDSLSNKRNYYRNVRPRAQAAKLKRATILRNMDGDVNVICGANTDAEKAMNEELRTLQSFDDREQVMHLISRTTIVSEVEFEVAQETKDTGAKIQKCKETWAKYPHYKDGRLLIYEHSIKVNIKLAHMAGHYEALMVKVRKYFEKEGASSNLLELEMLAGVFNEVTAPIFLNPIKQITPPIKIMDIAEAEGPSHIKTIHGEHAPCCLVTKSYNMQGQAEISKSYLRVYDACISEITEPTPMEVALHLLTPYFIGVIDYPVAYRSYLRFIEKLLHGQLCHKTLEKHPHQAYNKFIRALDKL